MTAEYPPLFDFLNTVHALVEPKSILSLPAEQQAGLAFGLSIIVVFEIFLLAYIIIKRRNMRQQKDIHTKFWDIVRDENLYPSLAIFQFLLWTGVVLFGYFGISLTRLFSGLPVVTVLPQNLLIVMGIIAGTAVLGTAISRIKYDRTTLTDMLATKGVPSDSVRMRLPKFKTMLMENGKVALTRLQMFLLTCIGSGIYLIFTIIDIAHIAERPSLPDPGNAFVFIILLSQVIYLGGKLLRRKYIESVNIANPTLRVQDGLMRSLGGISKISRLRHSKQMKEFVHWCNMEVKEDPDWFLLKLSDKFVNEMLETTKPYYAGLFIKSISNEIRSITENQNGDKNKGVNYNIYDLNFSLKPLDFYIELDKLAEKTEATVRLEFKLYTDIQIGKLNATQSPLGIKIHTEKIDSNLKLSLHRISIYKSSVNYLYKPIDLNLGLEKRHLKINDLFVFGSHNNINVRIKDHNAAEPLLYGDEYCLFIDIHLKSFEDIFAPTHLNFPPPRIKIFLAGEAFEIADRIHEVYWAPNKDYQSVTFNVRPKLQGKSKLDVFFYNNLDLLQVISIPFTVIPREYKSKSFRLKFKREETFLPIEVMSSADQELEVSWK